MGLLINIFVNSAIEDVQALFYISDTAYHVLVILKNIYINKNGLKFVAACVTEDLHEVGLRMVSDILELEGCNTLYLGANVCRRQIC